MKGEKMTNLYLDFPVLKDLIHLKEDSRLTSCMKDRIQILEQDLQFLVLYRFCLTNLVDRIYVKKNLSRFGEISAVDATLERKGLLGTGVIALGSGKFEDWETVSSGLLEEIQSYKKTIMADCFNFSGYLFDTSFSVNQLQKLLRYIAVSLVNIHLLKGEIIPHEQMKFESLKEKLDLFRKIFKFSSKYCSSDYEITDLHSKIGPLRAWAWNAACFCLLNWVLDEKDENMAPKMNLILSKLQWNFDRVLPDVTSMCLLYLKATKPSADVRFKVAELVSRFVEFLLGNLKGYLVKDRFEVLLNGMIFLITFLTDSPPPEANQGQLILIQDAAAAVDMVASLIISIGSGRIADATNFPFHVFLGKVNAIKAEVRKAYPRLFLDSSFNCPRIDIMRLFDSIIENLEGISFHFPNHPILTVHQELVLLRDLLKSSNLKKLQNEHKELKDPWTRISNVAHQADRTIRSFTYLKGFLWVDMLCLFDVKEETKRIRTVVKRIQGQHMHDIDACRTEMNLSPIVPLQTNVQTMDEVVVGFEGKAKDIRDWLISGLEKLNIISIIGMPGLGKTTLAKKVYNDPSIKRHFTTCAWCTVSQSYDSKKLLLNILNDVTVVNDSFFKMEEEELADRLRKCLKGQKYLIVMDDIWDVGAWNALKLSFPDDGKYSRILFTSRIHDVVLRAKSDSFPYPLTPLSKEESWELLEKKLFHDKDICPRDFFKVGKQIARDCKGLPLAVVLVAGLLKKKLENLDWWKQIGESIDSRISKQGCAHILELSYKHLPEPLKACFLYFGIFQDKVIRVQKLTKLWVSERFIPMQDMKNVEIVAKEYVMDLVGRSLLIVTKRSSTGGIKSCRIHDLLREFCLAKSEEENFFKLLHGNDVSRFSRDSMSKHYRMCIQAQHYSSFLFRHPSPVHSLLISPTHIFEPFGMDYSSFCNMKFLQVLDLEDVKFLGDFPEEVTALILLRYLAIWCTTKLIPPTIVRLENLETLRVRTENTLVFPSEILRLENLRHLDIGKFVTHCLFGNARPMKNIQSFSSPSLSYGKDAEIFLRKIPTIQKLRCQFGSHLRGGQIAKLDFLNHLESLNAIHGGPLWLHSFGLSLPSTLKKLTLSNFRLPWIELSRIAKLPNLEVLKLLAYAFMGKWWNAENDEFLKLKFLKLHNLDIEQWSAYQENFPSLEHIVVEQCHRLEEIPTTFGDLPTLRMVQVRRCRSSVVNSARDIQEQQIELGNEAFQLLSVQILKQNFFR